MTVPSRPTKGALLPSVPSRLSPRSSSPLVLGSSADPPEGRSNHASLDRTTLVEQLFDESEILAHERIREVLLQLSDVVPVLAEVEPALQRDRQRYDRQRKK